MLCSSTEDLIEPGIDMDWSIATDETREPKLQRELGRVVECVKEGIQANLQASGLHPSRWQYAGRHFLFAWSQTFHGAQSLCRKTHSKLLSAEDAIRSRGVAPANLED